MQLRDIHHYLPDDILYKVDIASMSVGLEVRVPLLDHRLFDWSWQLPPHLRSQDGRGKIILRRLLADYFPSTWFDRTKRGFSAPLDPWLRTLLREWAESLLAPACLERTGLFEPTRVATYWHEFLTGQAGHARIWPVLIYLAWQEQYLSQRLVSPTPEHRLRDASRDTVSVGRLS